MPRSKRPHKRVDALRVADFERFPVWKFTNDDEDELRVEPVARRPIGSAMSTIFGLRVKLANGRQVWATISNVWERDATATEHFLTLSVERDGTWFHLARYHDADYRTRGPRALATFLGVPMRDVFPIAYDLRPYARGARAALVGDIPSRPRGKLTAKRLMELVIELTKSG